ncbi:MAG: DUF928 domain-containing protein [Cyanobacteria bacterium P01_F01_bin.4]
MASQPTFAQSTDNLGNSLAIFNSLESPRTSPPHHPTTPSQDVLISTETPYPLVALRYNPPNRGAPSLTRNAGSRTGLCSDMTALQPTQTNWGETLDVRPTFGIYVAEPVSSLTFELKDILSNEIVHRTTFETIEGPGISLYQLPDTAASLEPDRLYRWQISLDCELTGKTDKADGVIMRRVASDELQAALDATPEADMPTLLAEHGLWYDAVKTLLMQRLRQSENETLVTDWQQLMQHPVVQLDNLLSLEFWPVPKDTRNAAFRPHKPLGY